MNFYYDPILGLRYISSAPKEDLLETQTDIENYLDKLLDRKEVSDKIFLDYLLWAVFCSVLFAGVMLITASIVGFDYHPVIKLTISFWLLFLIVTTIIIRK